MRVSYRIDAQDRLIAVGDAWQTCAHSNNAPELCKADTSQRPLWSFIAGQETVHLYRLLIEKVRKDQRTIHVPLRCDAPDMRRYMTIALKSQNDGHVEFTCETHHCEVRQSLAILDPMLPRSDDLITMCSFCKSVACEGFWFKIEDAIASMQLFERETAPHISHGACPECYDGIMSKLAPKPH